VTVNYKETVCLTCINSKNTFPAGSVQLSISCELPSSVNSDHEKLTGGLEINLKEKWVTSPG